jgi:hypothetical protein
MMSIQTLRARAAALVAVPALAAGGLLAAAAPAAHAAPACSVATIEADTSAAADLARSVNTQTSSLNSNSAPGVVRDTAQAITGNLAAMSNELGDDANSLQQCGPLNNADSQAAATAFSGMTSATVQMLNALTGAHIIFAQYGATAPIASALRALESALDHFSGTLTQIAPSQVGDIDASQSQADSATGNAITTYDQLCIPSPLYPTLPPICVGL